MYQWFLSCGSFQYLISQQQQQNNKDDNKKAKGEKKILKGWKRKEIRRQASALHHSLDMRGFLTLHFPPPRVPSLTTRNTSAGARTLQVPKLIFPNETVALNSGADKNRGRWPTSQMFFPHCFPYTGCVKVWGCPIHLYNPLQGPLKTTTEDKKWLIHRYYSQKILP